MYASRDANEILYASWDAYHILCISWDAYNIYACWDTYTIEYHDHMNASRDMHEILYSSWNAYNISYAFQDEYDLEIYILFYTHLETCMTCMNLKIHILLYLEIVC